MREKIKVIYIMGSGRSGSTLLNLLLGAHTQGFAAGELRKLHEVAKSKVDYCSCGETASECGFWLEVRATWAQVLGFEPESYPDFQSKFERLRAVGGALYGFGRGIDVEAHRSYTELTLGLLEAVRSVSGAAYITDSSHWPGRAWELANMDGIDLRLIHLVRDPRGVAHSLRKAFEPDPTHGIPVRINGQSPASAVVRWISANAVCNRIRALLGGRALLLRYEDLVRDPIEALKRIERLAGIDLSHVSERIRSGADFVTQHMIAGNRMRIGGSIRIRPDQEWQTGFGNLRGIGLGLLAAPVARHYAYPIRIPSVAKE